MSYIRKLGVDEEEKKDIVESTKNEDEIAWVFPHAIPEWEKRIRMKRLKQIKVRTTEKALVYHKEAILQELSNGIYDIDRKQGVEEHKIVFLTSSPITLKWGIPQMQGVLTADNVKTGASGTITLTLTGAEIFCTNVLKNKKKMTQKNLKSRINILIKEAMREIVAQYSIEELQKIGKDELLMMIEPSIVNSLMRLGLSSQDFSISGLGIPPEFRTY